MPPTGSVHAHGQFLLHLITFRHLYPVSSFHDPSSNNIPFRNSTKKPKSIVSCSFTCRITILWAFLARAMNVAKSTFSNYLRKLLIRNSQLSSRALRNTYMDLKLQLKKLIMSKKDILSEE